MGPSRVDESRGYAAVAISIAFVAIAGTFVAIRFVARLGLVRRCGADDLLIIAAMGLSAALTALIAIRDYLSLFGTRLLLTMFPEQKHGLGRHFDTLSTSEFRAMLKVNLKSYLVVCSSF
jgi:hypothetical protein